MRKGKKKMERKNIKNIIREVPTEYADFGSYFEGDFYTERSGDYCNTMFIIQHDYGRVYGLNSEEYNRVAEEMESIYEDAQTIIDEHGTYKNVMELYGIKYNPTKCHRLKEFLEEYPENNPETVAEWLSIKTGKEWSVTSARGYCQGDYCQIIYCTTPYCEQNAIEAGEVYIGAATEYCVIDLDENGEETETIYGYIVPESTAYRPEDVKKIVCLWAGINPEETILQTISGYNTRTEYKYEEA